MTTPDPAALAKLDLAWSGFVWMNPPFGARMGIVPWLDKFFAHGNGVALTPDRTSASWWIANAARADAVLFVGKPNPRKRDPNKINFIPGPGVTATSNGSGTTLMAAGPRGVSALQNAARASFGILMTNAPSSEGHAARPLRDEPQSPALQQDHQAPDGMKP